MHDLRIAGTELERADKPHGARSGSAARRCERRPCRLAAACTAAAASPPGPAFRSASLRPTSGSRGRQLAWSPSTAPSSTHRRMRWISSARQRMLADERSVGGIRFPRRHVAALGDGRDERRAPLHVVIGEQAERSRAAGVMTHRTAIGDQRRDVLGVRDGFSRCARDRRARQNATTKTRRHEKENAGLRLLFIARNRR